MRLLFIKPKHIGDTLLLTPTLVAAKQAYPDAEIWVAVRRGCESILAGCPEIDRILLLAAVEKVDRTLADTLRELKIFAQLASTRFDYVFELGDGHRGRLFARAARTHRRCSVMPDSRLKDAEAKAFQHVSTFDWRDAHRVKKDYLSVAEFLPLPAEIPSLRFDRARAKAWAPAARLEEFVVLQIGTRQGFNQWDCESWQAVAASLLTRVKSVVVTSGGGAEDRATSTALQAEFGSRILCTLGKADWPAIADLLYRAQLYVGPATAAMHLAAACGCPSVAMMGRTVEEHWHPWRAPYLAVNTIDIAATSPPSERERLTKLSFMRDIPPQAVITACEKMLHKPRDPTRN